MRVSPRLLLSASLLSPVPGLAAESHPEDDPLARGHPAEERAGDPRPFVRLREWFFSDARPDPVHEKYEELFGEPLPDEGFHSFAPLRPFEDVRRFNDAFELKAVSGARASVQRGDGRMTVSVEAPGTADRPLEVRVDEEKVLLSFHPKDPPRKYFVSKREEHEVPLPELADPATAQVVRSGDGVRVFVEVQPDRPPERRRHRYAARKFTVE